jgi:hypothetical protein
MVRLQWPIRWARGAAGAEGAPLASDISAKTFSANAIRTLYGCMIAVTTVLIVINVTKPSDWSVDTTTLGLVGVICALPLIDRLRKFKVGGVEVELDELRHEVRREVAELRREAAATGAGLAEERGEDDDAAEPASIAEAAAPPIPIDRIVWVDDNPEQNEAYASQLGQRFDVECAVSTRQGLALIGESPERTLVITDAVRAEGGSMNFRAGRDLMEALRRTHPGVPVLVFAGFGTIRDYGPSFRDAGAQEATSTFTELAEHVTTIARRRFRAAVAEIVTAAGGRPDPRGPSGWSVVTQDDRRVRVEARDWRRRPTPTALNKVWNRAESLLSTDSVDEILVAVPVNRVTEAQLAGAPERLEVLTLEELTARLGVVQPAA